MDAYLPFNAVELWHIAGWTMIHSLWLGTLIAGGTLVLRVLLRRASPNVRYATALFCLILLAATPLAVAAWLIQNTHPLQREARGGAAGGSSAITAVEMSPAQRNRSHVVPAADNVETIELSGRKAPLLADSGASADGLIDEPAGGSEVAARGPSPNPSLKGSGIFVASPSAEERRLSIAALESYVPYLPWVWLVGTPLTLALLATGIVGTERLRRTSRPINAGPVADVCAQLRKSLHIGRRVAIATCERIAAPVLVGIVRPMILLPPAALTGWSPDEIEMVLLHELAHVRRWDNLVNLLQRLVESLLFFHPAVWLVSSWARREREACCDAVVVGRTNRRQAYAELLVALAAQMPRSVLFHPAASSAMAAGPLRKRIRRILQLEDDPMLISGKSFALMLAALVTAGTLAVLYLPTIGQAEQSTTEGTENTERESAEESAAVGEDVGEPAQKPGEGIDWFGDPIGPQSTHDWWGRPIVRDESTAGDRPADFALWPRDRDIARRARKELGLKLVPAIEAELEQVRPHGWRGGLKLLDFEHFPHLEGPFILTEISSKAIATGIVSFSDLERALDAIASHPSDDLIMLKGAHQNGQFSYAMRRPQAPPAAASGEAEQSTTEDTEGTKENPKTGHEYLLDAHWPEGEAVTGTIQPRQLLDAELNLLLREIAQLQRNKTAIESEVQRLEGLVATAKSKPDDSPTAEKQRLGYLSATDSIIADLRQHLATVDKELDETIKELAQKAPIDATVIVQRRALESAQSTPRGIPGSLGGETPQDESRNFPSLEEQQLADLAYRRLQLELEPIDDEELKRVQALGYDGGLRITTAPGGMGLGILVGLHVWPTTSLANVAEILNRDDLAELTPLKYYTVDRNMPTGEDVVRTGRISVNLEPRLQRSERATLTPAQRPPAALPSDPYQARQLISQNGAKAADTSSAAAPPQPSGAERAELEILHEHVKILEEQFKRLEDLYKAGKQGAPLENVLLAAYELALARGELALGEDDRERALGRFKESRAHAEEALKAVTKAYEAGNATYDTVRQAARNLASIKRKIIHFENAKPITATAPTGKPTLPAQQSPPVAPSKPAAEVATLDVPRYVLPPREEEAARPDESPTKDRALISAPPDWSQPRRATRGRRERGADKKPSLRYEGKTFDEWKQAWRTELSVDKRLDAVKALAAFGAAGFGREAAEEIIELAGQYDWSSYGANQAILPLQSACLHAFGRAGGVLPNELPTNEALSALLRAADSANKSIRQFVAMALRNYARTDATAMEAVVQLSRDRDAGVGNVAWSSLIEVYAPDSRAAYERVREALASEDSGLEIRGLNAVRHYAMFKRAAIKLPELPEIYPLLFSDDEQVRRHARAMLPSLTEEDAADVARQLLDVLQDVSRRQEHLHAIRALAALGPKAARAVPALQAIFRSDENSLRIPAAAALKAIMHELEFNKFLGRTIADELKIEVSDPGLITLRGFPDDQIYQKFQEAINAERKALFP